MSLHNSLKSLFIIDGLRTPIGSPLRSLKDFSAARLGAVVIQSLLKRNHISKRLIDEVILGNVVSAGTAQNLARQAAILGGLPVDVPAFTVNHLCGAGMQAMILGARAIMCGEKNLVLAGATESASHNPYLYFGGDEENLYEKKKNVPLSLFVLPVSKRSSVLNKEIMVGAIESLILDGLWCNLTKKHMGNLADYIATKFKISRQAQDYFSLESHRKACLAQDQGKFREEIVPIPVTPSRFFVQDERPRRNINIEKLFNLPPAFKKTGTVTAVNSSVPCDGAVVLALASWATVKKERLPVSARILGYASVAVPPQEVFTAAIPAIKKCLNQCKLSLKEMDLFEVSEAFSAQAILTQKILRIPDDKMNIWGGDIAMGHPLAAAGVRGVVTLMHALKDQKKKKGIACVCLGGGGAIALAIEVI